MKIKKMVLIVAIILTINVAFSIVAMAEIDPRPWSIQIDELNSRPGKSI